MTNDLEKQHTPFVFLAVDIRRAAGDMIEKIGALTAHEFYQHRVEDSTLRAAKLMDLRDLREAVEHAQAALNNYDALVLASVEKATREQFEDAAEVLS